MSTLPHNARYSPPTKPSPYQRPMSMYTQSPPPPLPQERKRRPTLNEVSQHSLNNSSQAAIPLSMIMDSADSKNPPYPLSVRIVPDGGQSAGGGLWSPYYQGNVLIHYEMKLKIVEVLFERGGTYKVPLCSSNKFSILHNPNNNMAQAMMGHYYETVGHILAQHHKPKVVCATRTYKGSSTNSSVQDGDILIILKVGKKSIKCLNVETNQKKELADRCAGAFTTQPEKIKMPLREICKNVTLPEKAIMHYQKPNSMTVTQTVVTLLKEVWEDSVIATHSSVEETVYRNIQLLRIVRDVGMNFVMEDLDYTECSVKTCTIYRDFNYFMILHHLFCEDTVWPNHIEVQSSLYSQVDLMGESMDQYMVLKKPSKAMKTVQKSRRGTLSGSHGKLNQLGLEDYQTLKPITNEELSSRSVIDPSTVVVMDNENMAPTDNNDDEDPSMEDIATILHTVNTVNRQMMITVESLRAEVEGLKMELKQTKKMMNNMKKDLTTKIDQVTELCSGGTEYVTMEPGSESPSSVRSTTAADNVIKQSSANKSPVITKSVKPPVASKPTKSINADNRKSVKQSSTAGNDNEEVNNESAENVSPKMNVDVLKQLDHEKVLQILNKLQLSKYIPAFQRSQVSGADLAKYDEGTLQSQLGIQSQADRTCLMEVIQGSLDKWKILAS